MEATTSDAGGDQVPVNYVFEHLPNDKQSVIHKALIDRILTAEDLYYESKGYKNQNVEENGEVEIDELEMLAFIKEQLDDDTDENDILLVLDLEFEYGQSIGMYA